MPTDINPNSGMRLPLPNREDLDEVGKRLYDNSAKPGASLAGLQGPGGLKLYSPKTAEMTTALNRYLRFDAGFSPRVREVTILATAREMDSQFEWVAHEDEALRVGVPAAVIDIIKHRKSTDSIDRADGILIDLVRQMLRDHKVASQTFAEAKAMFGDTQLIELIMLSGTYVGTAMLLSAVDMQLHTGKQPLLPIP